MRRLAKAHRRFLLPGLLLAVSIGIRGEALGKSSARSKKKHEAEIALTRGQKKRYVLDLAGIKKRGVLRVLTRNSSATYFIEKGAQRGFQYELALAFAAKLGVGLRMVVPSSRTGLMPALLAGEGDMIAAGMTRTPARAEKVRYSTPVMAAARVLAVREGETRPISKLKDLKAFKIHVSFNSTTYRDALALQKKLGFKLHLENIHDDVEMEEMARRLSRGEYEAIIIDDNLLELSVAAGEQVKAGVKVSKSRQKAWAFHPDAPVLAKAADRFLKQAKKKRLLQILHARYYRPDARGARIARESQYRADDAGHLSPYDALFQRVAKEEDLDWRLLAAVAYTESQFDPTAKSRWGAVGLMQVLPKTGERVGIKDLDDPEQNIRAGARYLTRLLKQFPRTPKTERIRFALAAYNAGLGHVLDAQKLAQQTGRDPQRWFGNVEQAFLLKMDPKWHEKTRHGYARALETVRYVSLVVTRHDAYARHLALEPGD